MNTGTAHAYFVSGIQTQMDKQEFMLENKFSMGEVDTVDRLTWYTLHLLSAAHSQFHNNEQLPGEVFYQLIERHASRLFVQMAAEPDIDGTTFDWPDYQRWSIACRILCDIWSPNRKIPVWVIENIEQEAIRTHGHTPD